MVDYEKKYKEALKRAKKIYDNAKELRCVVEAVNLETIFPEINESEDEKIRKMLIDSFTRADMGGEIYGKGVTYKQVIAWLEKQGEQKPIMNVPTREVILSIWDLGNEWKELTNGSISTEYGTQLDYIQKHWYESEYYLREKQGEQKSVLDFKASNWYVSKVDGKIHDMTYNPADKVEPKFKVDDWITDGEAVFHVIDYNTEHGYQLVTQKGTSFHFSDAKIDSKYHLWDILDAKNGDVLSIDQIEGYSSPFVCIYKRLNWKEDPVDFDSQCFVAFNGKFYTGENGHSAEDIHPATKEQRNLLFQKMKEAGYEWDAEKLELKKIEPQPSTWSEEDDAYKLFAMSAVEDYYDEENPLQKELTDWLKSLKERVGCEVNNTTTKEWSEEDERERKRIIGLLEGWLSTFKETCYAEDCKHGIDWLKSLKNRVQPQIKKWSDEDEKMCQETIDWFEKKCFPYALEEENPASESIKWLKSLKGCITYKPSKEQMKTLEYYMHTLLATEHKEVLFGLYNDLKKL